MVEAILQWTGFSISRPCSMRFYSSILGNLPELWIKQFNARNISCGKKLWCSWQWACIRGDVRSISCSLLCACRHCADLQPGPERDAGRLGQLHAVAPREGRHRLLLGPLEPSRAPPLPYHHRYRPPCQRSAVLLSTYTSSVAAALIICPSAAPNPATYHFCECSGCSGCALVNFINDHALLPRGAGMSSCVICPYASSIGGAVLAITFL